MNKRKIVGYVGAALLSLSGATGAHAIDTLVQFSTTGSGTGSDGSYNMTNIAQFDWQSSGDLVIHNILPTTQTAGGTSVNTFAQWAANAVVGDTVAFNFDAQARLNDMVTAGGTSAFDDFGITNFSRAGSSGTGFEITGAVTGTETAVLSAPGVLTFTGITGTFKYFFDPTADSDVATGTGFTDGIAFVVGHLSDVTGEFNAATQQGATFLDSVIDSYLTQYIQADPDSNAPLTGSTFDMEIKLGSPLLTRIGVGGFIGLPPNVVLAGDLRLKADANSVFSATPVPEPNSLLLSGLGLLGLAALRNRKSSTV